MAGSFSNVFGLACLGENQECRYLKVASKGKYIFQI